MDQHISKHKNALHFKLESFEDASFSPSEAIEPYTGCLIV